MKTIVFLRTVFFGPMAMSADYEREKHWADEIIPSLVIGNPVFFKPAKALNFSTSIPKPPRPKPRYNLSHHYDEYCSC